LFKKYLSECNDVFLYEAINESKARVRSNDRDEAVLGMDFETLQSFKNNLTARKDNSKRQPAKIFFIIINYLKYSHYCSCYAQVIIHFEDNTLFVNCVAYF
jgi:hypothetical protein